VAALADRGHFVMELMEKGHEHAATTTESSLSGSEPVSASGFIDYLRNGRVSSRDVLAMTTQLSTAVRADYPAQLPGAHAQAAAKTRDEADVRAPDQGRQRRQGPLGSAGGSQGGLQSAVSVHDPRGRDGGILEQTSTQLAMILAREEKIKSNMKTAAAYPIFVLCLGIASAVLVVTVMLPKSWGPWIWPRR